MHRGEVWFRCWRQRVEKSVQQLFFNNLASSSGGFVFYTLSSINSVKCTLHSLRQGLLQQNQGQFLLLLCYGEQIGMSPGNGNKTELALKDRAIGENPGQNPTSTSGSYCTSAQRHTDKRDLRDRSLKCEQVYTYAHSQRMYV